MPNYVYTKDYYRPILNSAQPPHKPFYVCPRRRYLYWTPAGLRNKKQSHSSAQGNRTSPFISFWYCHLGKYQDEFVRWWKATQQEQTAVLAKSLHELPAKVRDASDPMIQVNDKSFNKKKHKKKRDK